jgi:hypothetical protein
MGANKRQQTMAKIRREQAVRERRALKQEKKEAARRAKAAGNAPSETPEADGAEETAE